jgi:hypothetical protein
MKQLKGVLIFFSFVLYACGINKQIHNTMPATVELNITDRPSNALSGSELLNLIRKLPRKEREDILLEQFKRGNIPNFLRQMIRVSDSQKIGNKMVQIHYYVLPDYLALGSDNDYFLCPMTPVLAQKIANESSCILPTRKMVDQIWDAATVKMRPKPIPPSDKMITVPVFEQHNNQVWEQRKTFLSTYPLGSLVSGHKKDVILSNKITGASWSGNVVIYGWHYKSGKPIQPLYGGHADSYADYSHGIRLINNAVYVNGKPMLASELLRSDRLHTLVSDEGPIIQAYH